VNLLIKHSVFCLLCLSVLLTPLSYAQHHGGEQAPPVSFGDGQVTVTASLIPADYVPNNDEDVNLKIRFFDLLTNTNIDNVSYRVQIFYGDKLVANQMFFDQDGDLDIKIHPKSSCDQEDLWKCTKYFGDKDPVVPSALTSSPSSIPVISGPVFIKSGKYTVSTDIIGAKNPKTVTSEDIHFETNLVIPSTKEFTVKSGESEYSILTKNFQEPIEKLEFNDTAKSFTFQIPFNWEHVEHTDYVKSYIEIPKDFSPFKNVNTLSAKVNDFQVFPKDAHFDKFSNKKYDVIHFMILKEELKLIKNSNGALNVEIAPESQSLVMNKEIKFDNGYYALVSYDSRYSKSNDFVFSIAFFDPDGKSSSDIRYGYGIKDPSGREHADIGGNPKLLGISLPNGYDIRTIGAELEGEYSMQIVLLGIGNKNFDKQLLEEFDLKITSQNSSKSPPASESIIPAWIKNNAGWWADGSIDDHSFIQGIQFLIKENLITVSQTSQGPSSNSKDIPVWIKNNAGWWADGSIDDHSFIKGIEFLIKEGIIILN
jgi:hypothetical protein